MIPVRAFRSISSCHPSVVTCSPLGQVQRQMQWRSCPEGGHWPSDPTKKPNLTNLTHPTSPDPYPIQQNTFVEHHHLTSFPSFHLIFQKEPRQKKPEHHPQPPENLHHHHHHHHHHISKQNPHLPSFPPLASPGRWCRSGRRSRVSRGGWAMPRGARAAAAPRSCGWSTCGRPAGLAPRSARCWRWTRSSWRPETRIEVAWKTWGGGGGGGKLGLETWRSCFFWCLFWVELAFWDLPRQVPWKVSSIEEETTGDKGEYLVGGSCHAPAAIFPNNTLWALLRQGNR